jgi:hypothetical protein
MKVSAAKVIGAGIESVTLRIIWPNFLPLFCGREELQIPWSLFA